MSNLISIKINNWKKYNKGSQRILSPWWFPLSNQIHFDREIRVLDFEERWAWICILAEASRNKKDTIIIDLENDPKNWGINRRKLSETIEKLELSCILKSNLYVTQVAHKTVTVTRQDNIYTQTDVCLPPVCDLVKIWNENRGKLAEVKSITAKRSRLIAQAVKEISSCDDWIKIVKYLSTDLFYSGKNDRGWCANFDFLIRPGKAVELLERATNKSTRGESEWEKIKREELEKENANKRV